MSYVEAVRRVRAEIRTVVKGQALMFVHREGSVNKELGRVDMEIILIGLGLRLM